jgi:hypothetical protein
VPDGVFPICISSTSARAVCSWRIKSDQYMRFTGSRFRPEFLRNNRLRVATPRPLWLCLFFGTSDRPRPEKKREAPRPAMRRPARRGLESPGVRGLCVPAAARGPPGLGATERPAPPHERAPAGGAASRARARAAALPRQPRALGAVQRAHRAGRCHEPGGPGPASRSAGRPAGRGSWWTSLPHQTGWSTGLVAPSCRGCAPHQSEPAALRPRVCSASAGSLPRRGGGLDAGPTACVTGSSPFHGAHVLWPLSPGSLETGKCGRGGRLHWWGGRARLHEGFSGNASTPSPSPCNWVGIPPCWVISHTDHLT